MAKHYSLNAAPGTKPGRSGLNYAAELNEQQFAAVTSQPGPALVIAGAGSGKTRTLTYRVAYLLDQGVEARAMLLLTFTNKAAREMLTRVAELVPVDIMALWGGTFHSVGNRILRRHADELGFTRSFTILDSDDRKALLKQVVDEAGIAKGVKRFPKAEVLGGIFSLAENMGENVETVIDTRYPHLIEWLEEITNIQTAYTKRKGAVNSMDFDDLLTLPLKLLREQEELRKLYQQRFRHVLVDEYQDTNAVQCELIDLLAGGSRSLMVVGDDAQSIYSWRGANMEHILGFPTRYPEAEIYRIETNYRSLPGILELSNAAIQANERQFQKSLRAERPAGGPRPALVPLETPGVQARFVTQRIQELTAEGVQPSEIAVLYRAHHQSLEIQMELTRSQIPFGITSGLRFFEQAHVKDVAAFLRFVTNGRDEISFQRMVTLLPGIGAQSSRKIWQAWLSLSNQGTVVPPSYRDLLKEVRVPKKAAEDWDQLLCVLDELAPGGSFARPAEMIFSVVEGLYDDHLQENFDNHENRRADLQQLMDYAGGFEQIEEFLSQLSLLSEVDREQETQTNQTVTLSTIHQAKGLEWKAVFLIWLAEGMFPNRRVIDSDNEAALEEERRLFYVALTRAKDELYLCYPQTNPKSYLGDLFLNPSRFLRDCPEDLLEQWEVGAVW